MSSKVRNVSLDGSAVYAPDNTTPDTIVREVSTVTVTFKTVQRTHDELVTIYSAGNYTEREFVSDYAFDRQTRVRTIKVSDTFIPRKR